MDNSQFDNSDIKPKKTETVYTCDNCPHAGNLMCCHNCPNFSNFVDDESIVNRTEAQRYDEAVKKVKDYYEGKTKMYSDVKQTLDLLFPELKEKESEDDRTRKAILTGLIDCRDAPDLGWSDFGGINIDECIAWIEKQDGHKPYGQRKECEDCQFNYAGECKGYCALKRNEHKPTDEVEPKFHEGDWVVFIPTESVYQVEKIENHEYILRHIFGGSLCLSFSDEKFIREWTIQDAEDGHVLASNGKRGQEVGIVKEFIGKYGGYDKCFETYCYSDLDGTFRIGEYMGGTSIHPATKEQRDLLFQKMADAGYKWDAGKKELWHKL